MKIKTYFTANVTFHLIESPKCTSPYPLSNGKRKIKFVENYRLIWDVSPRTRRTYERTRLSMTDGEVRIETWTRCGRDGGGGGRKGKWDTIAGCLLIHNGHFKQFQINSGSNNATSSAKDKNTAITIEKNETATQLAPKVSHREWSKTDAFTNVTRVLWSLGAVEVTCFVRYDVLLDLQN